MRDLKQLEKRLESLRGGEHVIDTTRLPPEVLKLCFDYKWAKEEGTETQEMLDRIYEAFEELA